MSSLENRVPVDLSSLSRPRLEINLRRLATDYTSLETRCDQAEADKLRYHEALQQAEEQIVELREQSDVNRPVDERVAALEQQLAELVVERDELCNQLIAQREQSREETMSILEDSNKDKVQLQILTQRFGDMATLLKDVDEQTGLNLPTKFTESHPERQFVPVMSSALDPEDDRVKTQTTRDVGPPGEARQSPPVAGKELQSSAQKTGWGDAMNDEAEAMDDIFADCGPRVNPPKLKKPQTVTSASPKPAVQPVQKEHITPSVKPDSQGKSMTAFNAREPKIHALNLSKHAPQPAQVAAQSSAGNVGTPQLVEPTKSKSPSSGEIAKVPAFLPPANPFPEVSKAGETVRTSEGVVDSNDSTLTLEQVTQKVAELAVMVRQNMAEQEALRQKPRGDPTAAAKKKKLSEQHSKVLAEAKRYNAMKKRLAAEQQVSGVGPGAGIGQNKFGKATLASSPFVSKTPAPKPVSAPVPVAPKTPAPAPATKTPATAVLATPVPQAAAVPKSTLNATAQEFAATNIDSPAEKRLVDNPDSLNSRQKADWQTFRKNATEDDRKRAEAVPQVSREEKERLFKEFLGQPITHKVRDTETGRITSVTTTANPPASMAEPVTIPNDGSGTQQEVRIPSATQAITDKRAVNASVAPSSLIKNENFPSLPPAQPWFTPLQQVQATQREAALKSAVRQAAEVKQLQEEARKIEEATKGPAPVPKIDNRKMKLVSRDQQPVNAKQPQRLITTNHGTYGGGPPDTTSIRGRVNLRHPQRTRPVGIGRGGQRGLGGSVAGGPGATLAQSSTKSLAQPPAVDRDGAKVDMATNSSKNVGEASTYGVLGSDVEA